MFNCLCLFWPKAYQRESLAKSHQISDYLKQALRERYPSSGFKPAAFELPAHYTTTLAREDVFCQLNFGFLNPATWFYYDVDNNLIVMF